MVTQETARMASIDKNPNAKTVLNFINGQWEESLGEQTHEVINPATREVLAYAPAGTSDDVDKAVRAAKAAFPAWRRTPAIERVQFLFKLKTLLEDNIDELAQTITLENGKTFAEAKAEMRRAIQMVDIACAIPSLMMGEISEDIAPGIDSKAIKTPMGVFAGINPFNFPAMVPFWFWPFAVACGNTFIVKPSERVPLTQVRIFELIEQAGFPKGVMNMVQGSKDVVNGLCTHPDIKGVSFVGSTPVAKHVYQTATATGKRVQALGGAKNFMVVLPDANMDLANRVIMESCTGCAGQRCLAGSVILAVGDEAYKTLEDGLARLAPSITVGNGLEAANQIGPVISEAAQKRIVELIDSAEKSGARILVDGRKAADNLPGFFVKPTIIADITREMRVAQEEIFGPVLCLAKVGSLNEAIEWLNDSPFGNTASLFTTSGAAARQFEYEADPGMLGVNIGVPAPMAFFSFGGTKDSFFGDIKAHGAASINFFTDTKVTIERWQKESNIW